MDLYPYPSDAYTIADPQSPTGRRLALPGAVMPDGMTSEVFASHDGFSRAPEILVHFPEGIDPTSLPDVPGSIEEGSSILLLDTVDFEPVPILAELDAQSPDPLRQALILRPQVVLAPSTGYVVLIRDSLMSLDGGPPAVTPAFRALRDGLVSDSPEVEAMRGDFAVVHNAIDARGLDRDEVVIGWSFHTRSSESVAGCAPQMHEIANAAGVDGWTLVSDTLDDGDRLIEGTFTAPDFLTPEHLIELDADGVPIVQGEREVTFLLTIPEEIDEPRPVIVYGHGFFSNREETTYGSLNDLLHEHGFSGIAVDFIGFNEDDFGTSLELMGIQDMSGFSLIANQQLQSHTHFTLLQRLVSEHLAVDVELDDGSSPIDADAVHYMGISNGGTQGLVILANSPTLHRGALVVGGGAWTHMMQRAVQWESIGALLEARFTDAPELQVVLALSQNLLDPVDSINYVERLWLDPRPGMPEKVISMHEAVGDAQVSNMITEWVMRSAGAPLVTPTPREVWGLDTIDASAPEGVEAPASLMMYDEGYDPLPEGNMPPDSDNGAHATIRDLESYKEQIGYFLETGRVLQVCDGPCDPD